MVTALLLQFTFRLIIGQTGIDLFAVEAAGPSLLYEQCQLEDAEFHSFHLFLLVVEEPLNNLHPVSGEEKFRPAHRYSNPRFRLIVSQAFFAASDLEPLLAVPLSLAFGISGPEGPSFANSQTGIGSPSLTKTGLTRASSRPAILNKMGFTGPNLNAKALGDQKA